jgi:NAD(P)H-nitrite reductase large subunit
MPKHIVVVGSGIAGVTFAEELRKLEREIFITLLTREQFGYYSRPLLSHGFTREDIETKIILKSFPVLVSNHIAVDSGADVIGLDRAAKTLVFRKDGEDRSLNYDTLVLAQGSDDVVPPPFRPQAQLFHALNSLGDLIALRRLRETIQARHPRPR